TTLRYPLRKRSSAFMGSIPGEGRILSILPCDDAGRRAPWRATEIRNRAGRPPAHAPSAGPRCGLASRCHRRRLRPDERRGRRAWAPPARWQRSIPHSWRGLALGVGGPVLPTMRRLHPEYLTLLEEWSSPASGESSGREP